MGNDSDKSIRRFLEDAAEQIAYKPLRPAIIKELEAHIEDRAEEYEEAGLSPEEACQSALNDMGDAVAIGTELNAVRQVRPNPVLAVLTVILAALGLCAAVYLRWTPEQYVNGFLYYIPGLAFLVLISYRGYPLLVKYRRKLLALAALFYCTEAVFFFFRRYVPDLYFDFPLPFHMIAYYALLLFGPVLITALYSLRRRGTAALLTGYSASAAYLLLRIAFDYDTVASCCIIFLVSIAATMWYMCRRAVFAGPIKPLCHLTAVGGVLLLGILAFIPQQKEFLKAFAEPEAAAHDTWDDAYNSILIKELLSRTPMLGEISLTPHEMVEYGTGAWYFDSLSSGEAYLPYLHYSEADVTLWNILPQHYHNNYLIAVTIFLFGWIPGLLLLTILAGFYCILFRCILRIRGKLAGSLAFCCGVNLLTQGILYVLGNFGYQYGTFPNLPLISEGKLSILVNALLLGFIFSAYRYDHVVDDLPEPVKLSQTAQRDFF